MKEVMVGDAVVRGRTCFHKVQAQESGMVDGFSF
jgi:hypothetical protein